MRGEDLLAGIPAGVEGRPSGEDVQARSWPPHPLRLQTGTSRLAFVDTLDHAGNPWLPCIKREQSRTPRMWRRNGGCRVSLVSIDRVGRTDAGSRLLSR